MTPPKPESAVDIDELERALLLGISAAQQAGPNAMFADAIITTNRRILALLAELRSLRGGVLLPGLNPATEVNLVVAPSGFVEGVYRGQPLDDGWRPVRYVPAPPQAEPATTGEG